MPPCLAAELVDAPEPESMASIALAYRDDVFDADHRGYAPALLFLHAGSSAITHSRQDVADLAEAGTDMDDAQPGVDAASALEHRSVLRFCGGTFWRLGEWLCPCAEV